MVNLFFAFLLLCSFQRSISERNILSKPNNAWMCSTHAVTSVTHAPSKGGDPAAPSDTATLLRLHPNHRPHLRRSVPLALSRLRVWMTFVVWRGPLAGFGCEWLSWCDGRCVQGPGTYSPQYADLRLLAIPTSCRRVAAYNPNWEMLLGFRSTSRFRFPLFIPL